MDNEIIVFAMGSAASYWPLYLVFRNVISKRRKTGGQLVPGVAAANRDFLELLHQEAVLRASAVLRDALTELNVSVRASSFPSVVICLSTRQRLEDTYQLMLSLSPNAAQLLYANAVRDISTATSANIQKVSDKVIWTLKALDASLAPQPADALRNRTALSMHRLPSRAVQ